MGFYFRRSSSFGPFRLNFSKSGIGASVGVKGARVTRSSRGTTYITVGSGGFYYRQNLFSCSKRPSPRPQDQTVLVQPFLDEIKTADVEDLLESSKGELVENLNKRAQMFNPASIVYVLAVICTAVGFVQLGGTTSSSRLPALPDLSDFSGTPRQSNRTDEYALLLARYGQPSAVTITEAGSVPLRISTYADAHLAVAFVPAGCVDSYEYFEAHKDDISSSRSARRYRGSSYAAKSGSPICAPPADEASTIVGYQDTMSGSTIDSGTAERHLTGLSTKSHALPSVKALGVKEAGKHELKRVSQPFSVRYNEEALKIEQQRIADVEASTKKNVKTGYEFLASALLLLVPGVLIHRNNEKKRMTRLVYDLPGAASAQQQTLDDALGQLMRSRVIWRLNSQSAVLDWKRNAGASYDVKRERISVRRSVPPRVESNIVPLCIDLSSIKMFFLPDQVLYWQRGTFASIGYKDLKFEAMSTRFIEDEAQIPDSQQVGSTWRYVRKDGGPDRRFNNNRQLPVMLYGVVTGVSSGGLNLVLHTSNVDAASSFAAFFKRFQSGSARHIPDKERHTSDEGQTKEKHRSNAACPENIEKAMVMLGVKPGATLEQVAVAYRHMAQMYHPDKVVGLGPELQRLADEQMKEINAAHQVVRQYLEGAGSSSV